jgi:hypothetical protein
MRSVLFLLAVSGNRHLTIKKMVDNDVSCSWLSFQRQEYPVETKCAWHRRRSQPYLQDEVLMWLLVSSEGLERGNFVTKASPYLNGT